MTMIDWTVGLPACLLGWCAWLAAALPCLLLLPPTHSVPWAAGPMRQSHLTHEGCHAILPACLAA